MRNTLKTSSILEDKLAHVSYTAKYHILYPGSSNYNIVAPKDKDGNKIEEQTMSISLEFLTKSLHNIILNQG